MTRITYRRGQTKRLLVQVGMGEGDYEFCSKTKEQLNRCFNVFTDLLGQYKDCDKCNKKVPTVDYLAKIRHMLD